MELKIQFDGFYVPNTDKSNENVRVVIPKNQYKIVGEDNSCYYLAATASTISHSVVRAPESEQPND